MTKGRILLSVIVGWVAIHLGLVIVGVVLGVAVTLPFDNHGGDEGYDEEYDAGFSDGFIRGLNHVIEPKTDKAQSITPVASSWSATPVPPPTPTPEPQTMDVVLTFYTCPPFCPGDTMANGQPLGEGDVACGYALDTGQRFTFNGDEYVCEDRGGGPHYWVDFWKATRTIGLAWQTEVGMSGKIILLEG
ncbi:hypothetical protein LCGC14_1203750 [marine sediment metagenome]|uniref:Uncharacterized protein n=1 Tax=marine sediment metagenome TaxID=412755 RepID=A0A0F9M3H9_9ZZZZ